MALQHFGKFLQLFFVFLQICRNLRSGLGSIDLFDAALRFRVLFRGEIVQDANKSQIEITFCGPESFVPLSKQVVVMAGFYAFTAKNFSFFSFRT